jgi:hypothetical protein
MRSARHISRRNHRIQNFIQTIKPYSKAIAGTLAGAIVAWLMKHDIIIADNLRDFIEVILGAIITGIIVFLSPANKSTEVNK